MQKTLHLFATLLCLLTLFVSAATCVKVALPKQSTCDQCPKQSPDDQHTPACCSAQQEQPSAIVSTPVEPQIQLQAVTVVASFNAISTPLTASVIHWTVPPPLRSSTPLRI